MSATEPVRLGVIGAAGRMGTRIIALAGEDDRFEVTAALEVAGHPKLGTKVEGVTITEEPSGDCDVLIDFSLPAATQASTERAVSTGTAVVIGTTGHDESQLACIQKAASRVAVLKGSNMSLGVNIFWRLARQAAELMREGHDIEIVESHHRYKADAPSGTALTLLEEVCKGAGLDPKKDAVYGREGNMGTRPPGQIGVHALRVGDTVGEHEVQFASLGETVTIKHVAHTRDIFVRGALRAAAWIHGKPPGLYTMQDVLFGE